MVQSKSHTNSPNCSSCFLRLCAIQSQIDRLERMLSYSKETLNFKEACLLWGIERSGFFNGREKWAKGFENQMV